MRKTAFSLLIVVATCCTQSAAQDAATDHSKSKAVADEITIISAQYGDLETPNVRDVTKILAAKVKDGKLSFDVNNDVLGDPAEGTRKTLHVKYELNGKTLEVKAVEGDMVLLPVPKLEGKLVVTKAVYGDLLNDEVFDVTNHVKSMVKDNALEVEVSNDWFGDPASGTMKRIRVEYKIGDVKLTKTRWEDSTLKITVPSPPAKDEESPVKDGSAPEKS